MAMNDEQNVDEAIRLMIASMSTVLSNKIKLSFLWPRKNRELA